MSTEEIRRLKYVVASLAVITLAWIIDAVIDFAVETSIFGAFVGFTVLVFGGLLFVSLGALCLSSQRVSVNFAGAIFVVVAIVARVLTMTETASSYQNSYYTVKCAGQTAAKCNYDEVQAEGRGKILGQVL